MSIDDRQRRRTSAELTALRARLPHDDAALEEALGYPPGRLAAVLAVHGADPREVWRVRDFLVAVADTEGITVPGFSVLQDSRRSDAQRWFGRWEVPAPPGR